MENKNQNKFKTLVDLGMKIQHVCHEGHSLNLVKINNKYVKDIKIEIKDNEAILNFEL